MVAYDSIPPYLGEPNMQYAIDARMEEAQSILQAAMEAVGDVPVKFTQN